MRGDFCKNGYFKSKSFSVGPEPSRRQKGSKLRKASGALKILAAILVGCLILAVAWPRKTIPVETVRLQQGDVEELSTPLSNAAIQAERYARIKSVATGEIEKIYFRKGDRVKQNELILKTRNKEESARLQLAEANLAAGAATMEQARIKIGSTQRELERAKELHKANLLSQSSFDQIKTEMEVLAQSLNVQESNLKQLNAQLNIARSAYEKTFVRAPFDGVVADLHVEEGEYMVLGIPAYDIYDDNSIYVTARFDEIDAARLRPGMEARMQADALAGRELHGLIESISPVVDMDLKAGRGVDVRFGVREKDPEIRIGMSVDIEVIIAVRKDVKYLPTSVIQGGEGGRFVLAISSKNRVEKLPIATGFSNWERTEVLSGVDESDRIISSVNLPHLKEGARVEVKE